MTDTTIDTNKTKHTAVEPEHEDFVQGEPDPDTKQGNKQTLPAEGNRSTGDRTFTQEDVNRLIERRLSRQRVRLEEVDKLRHQRDQLQLEVDDFRHRLEEENARNSEQRLIQHLTDAARSAGAIRPDQVAKLLKEQATLTDDGRSVVVTDAQGSHNAPDALQKFLEQNPHLASSRARTGAGSGKGNEASERFTREQIRQMSPGDFRRNEARILEAARRGNIL